MSPLLITSSWHSAELIKSSDSFSFAVPVLVIYSDETRHDFRVVYCRKTCNILQSLPVAQFINLIFAQ
jgi:hypothetical protein